MDWRAPSKILICGMIILFAGGCIPNPVKMVNSQGLTGIEIKWTYRDAQRFAMEFSITDYPLPLGFQTICPVTQLEMVNESGQNLLLYRNPEQISLDEFYAITQHSRWLCTVQRDDMGFADYNFSLTYSLDDKSDLFWVEHPVLRVDLGKVIATNSVSVITLPSQGTVDFSLGFTTGTQKLTWYQVVPINSQGVLVDINRVAVNPSFALLDACIEYQDHHFWKPVAAIVYQGKEAYSTESIPTFPRYPFDRDTILASTRRCYSLIIPFVFHLNSLSNFQIGVKQVEIVNNDPGVVTMQECETVKEQLEEKYPGLSMQCREFEIHDQLQHWFEVVSPPAGISSQDAYKLVESAFTQVLPGPWYIEVH